MARNSAASFVIGNEWHVIGGRTVNGGNTDRHDIFDFTDQRWRTGTPLPAAQGGLAAAAVGGHDRIHRLTVVFVSRNFCSFARTHDLHGREPTSPDPRLG